MLERYRAKLQTGRLVNYWSDESQLCLALLGSLNAMSKRTPRPGWIRGGGKSPAELQQAITELEYANKELTTLVEGSIVELVRWRLRNGFCVRYSCDVEGVPKEAALEISWKHLANYVLPRTKWATEPDTLDGIIRAFIEGEAKQSGLMLAKEELDKIKNALLANGLLSAIMDLSGHRRYQTASVGWAFVGDALESYEAMTRGFWADIRRTITRHLDKP
ncbi:hypothetical protein [Bradyrhizobium sp. URHC0002]